jgi:hypothetical protein
MKNFFVVLLFVAIVCAGCRTRYDIRLNNGEVITAKGRPHLDKDRTAWIFTDASGKQNAVPAGRVTEVSPQSIDTDSGTGKFIPSGTK